jgi:hypothetical protein
MNEIGRKCFFKYFLFASRVKFHKYAGIDNLDEWPAVKVSNSLPLYIWFTHNRYKAWVERIDERPATQVGLNVGK